MALLMMLPLVQRADSTTIVALSSKDQVILAADSLISVSEKAGRGHMCKIIVGGSYAAAFAGHLGDVATGFDVRPLVSASLAAPGNLSAKAEEFVKNVRDPLAQSLAYGRVHDPEIFSRQFLGKKALEVVFATVENGKPTLIVLTFRVTNTGELTVDSPKELGQGQIYVFGENEAIARYQASEPKWPQNAPQSIARRFLELEIADKPALVGGPISILSISSARATWADAGSCDPE